MQKKEIKRPSPNIYRHTNYHEVTLLSSFRNNLFEATYPGRTLIIGMNPSGTHYVQVYWIMGRSSNSRNRIFELEQLHVKNTAYDPAKMEDPSLIIYYPARDIEGYHIISNGDQTDTIFEGLQQSISFEDSLMKREFEPDAPHYTPRISGIIDTSSNTYCLSILKSKQNDPSVCIRNFFHFNAFTKGTGHCIHTYSCEVNGILQSFNGEPLEVPVFDSLDETASFYWDQINDDNKISLLVKFISIQGNNIEFKLINKNAY
ncbi:inosine monophosphate cyclohydrolase [Paenibacillus sp. LMG 31460]|uniref:Inosine monophosphate cyclohydrolase n=1 Tax=Paenibacillus germinis TaxID=2654979 RepID=A0ABX1Z610_9BACL|nr:inosine monophosphate cyclohydrolase [Paenibacillus germinis]